jgi:hypothetical protein
VKLVKKWGKKGEKKKPTRSKKKTIKFIL